MARVVGLDIGTFAVRAAELNLGSGAPTLTRFGQVALPPGAVRDGEVIDSEAVGAAIRRLWREGGFRGRDVVLGVANQRVIVRPAELPLMSEADLTTALQFEAQELIPIPVEEAILDFQILDQVAAPDGEPRMRILLAAAQRDMVRAHLAGVDRAGLNTSVVDPVPFALVRALSPLSGDEQLGAVEGIVCIGAGVTNVVVHEGGVARFVRIQLSGGDDLTEAIARELDVDLDHAEDLKRRAASGGGGTQELAAGRVVADRMSAIVEEIRGSLEYYQAQPDALPLRRVLITGGASRTAGLVERLQQQLFMPVEVAHPLQALNIADVGLSEAQLAEAEPLMTVAIGLGLAGAQVPRGTRRISLLPREVAELREQRRQAILVGSAVGALAVLLLLLWVLRGQQVAREERRAQEAEARAAQLETQAAALRDITQLDAQIQQRLALAQGALTGDVAWTRFIQEIATVMPGDVWLTSFSGAKGPTGATVNFSVTGFDHTSTARWLLRMGTLPSITGLWVPSSAKGEGASVLLFTSSATLTPAANSTRISRFQAAQ